MPKRNVLWLCLAAMSLSASQGRAETKTYALPEEVSGFRPGPGSAIAESNCLACHSSDYISTQPPGLGETFWETEVRKMRKSFGAQISDEDAVALIKYLARTY